MGACCSQPCTGKGELPDKYQWEQNVLDETVMKDGSISQSAIISFSDAELRAAAPRSFHPDPKVLKNIVAALKGDTLGISESLIALGSGSKTSSPGKVDEGKAIYGSDGHGGGCTIFKSNECVLIVIYGSGPSHATRLASEVAEYMDEQGH